MKSTYLDLKKWGKLGLALVILGAASWGYQWAAYARPPLPQAIEALQSDSLVTVSEDPWLSFFPTHAAPETGFIFYPGGRVDPRGYAPLMRALAAEGYLVIIPEMPLNMAPFDANAADEIRAYYPEIKRWVMGGHSVGGTMAAQYTFNHPGKISGLVFWASYPADSADLSGRQLPVSVIYGSLDPSVNADILAERIPLFPPQTIYVQIEGGDHHQFGAYEINPDEHFAAIGLTGQHQQIIEATLALLAEAVD